MVSCLVIAIMLCEYTELVTVSFTILSANSFSTMPKWDPYNVYMFFRGKNEVMDGLDDFIVWYWLVYSLYSVENVANYKYVIRWRGAGVFYGLLYDIYFNCENATEIKNSKFVGNDVIYEGKSNPFGEFRCISVYYFVIRVFIYDCIAKECFYLY